MKEFERIIGYSSEKKELEQVADCLRNSEVYENLGIKAPNGLLLYGEPGVGKTLMSQCLIEASGLKTYICRKNKPNGEFVNEITKTFEEAEKNAPCIVFLDDMDKFANGDANHRDAEEYVTVQSCIDKVKGKGVFVLATANSINCLPRSLLRAGWFDRRILVKAPKGADALEIISHYLEGKNLDEDVDRKYIARLVEGNSCAFLENIISEAGLYAGFDRKEKISMSHFMRAYLRNVYGEAYDGDDDFDDDDDFYSMAETTQNSFVRIAYHEAGHAVVSEVLDPGSVMLVSVSGESHGREKGGFTKYSNVNGIPGFDYALNRVVGGLGGMAAIEQKFGINRGGASADLNDVFHTLCNLITEECILGFHLHDSPYRNSESLDSRIELATAAEVEKYYRKAKQILANNSEFLDKIAESLLRKRILTAPEIEAIRKECTVVECRL